MQKCRFAIWITNNVKEQSRQVLIDYANMLNVANATKTLRIWKRWIKSKFFEL